MPIADAKSLTPSNAIEIAKGYFNEFFADTKTENVLLEELDFDDSTGVWSVTIGFDVGRTKMRQPNYNALAALSPQEVIPVREARRFFIRDEDSALIKLDVV